MDRELGDFSDHLRAKAKKKLPVWLTGPEIKRLLKELPEQSRLMAQVMFGGGPSLMELLRLRGLDLEQEIITVRAGAKKESFPGERCTDNKKLPVEIF